jgi:hypothetical protein
VLRLARRLGWEERRRDPGLDRITERTIVHRSFMARVRLRATSMTAGVTWTGSQRNGPSLYVLCSSNTDTHIDKHTKGIDIPITNVSQLREDVESNGEAASQPSQPGDFGRSSAMGTGEIASYAFGGNRWKLELGTSAASLHATSDTVLNLLWSVSVVSQDAADVSLRSPVVSFCHRTLRPTFSPSGDDETQRDITLSDL